ncbi:MAG: hypothetical protein IJL06_02170, partial [Kiritimatiellae bacterium]|nr:hypothetical protein [Kiritimatiellia bacterium]
MKKTAFLFLLPLLAAFAPSADAAALDASAFGKTVRLGVPAGAVQEDLEDFPVLVRLSDAAGFSFDDFADPAAELRFATADGENLDYEIDTWDSAQGALVWVSLPVLPAAGTNFTACFAPAPGVALPAVFPTSVWTKAGYLGVWHFSPAADGVYANSAQPSHFATPSAAAAERTDGVVGGCIKPASGTMFVNDSIAWAGDTPHMAVEAWVDRQGGGDQRVFGSQNRDKWSSGMAVRLDGYIYGNAMYSQQNFAMLSTGWQHFTVNFSATEQANALVNGTTELTFRAGGGTGADGDNTHFFHNTAQTNDDHLAVADFHAFSLTSRGTDNGLAFTGLADEFRVRGRNSSTAWMKAVRDSMADVLFLSAGRVLGPAPVLGAVAHVSSAETTAAFAVEVPWIGEGAASAALEALVLPATGPEDWASARRQPLAAFVSPTNATVSVSGFEPETDYRVLFVLSNAVAGYVRASTNGPASFRTAAADPVPSASLAAHRVWATAADLEISVSRFGWGATGLSSLVLRYGTDPSDEASWTAVALDPAAEGVPVSRRLLGLEPGTTYYARAFATNDLPQPRGTATSVVEFTPAVSPVVPSIATTGGNVATTVVGGLSTVVRFLDDGTFELPEETEARLLLVGGGG